MAQPVRTAYSVNVGQPIHGGWWPGGRLAGGVSLDSVMVAGAFGSASSALTGGVTLDGVSPGGSLDGYQMLTWLVGKAVNEWGSIPNTALAGSAAEIEGAGVKAVGSYNGMAWREDTGEIILPANGGHTDSSVNAVQSIGLNTNAPAWQIRTAATISGNRVLSGSGVGYNSDGLPRSRHTYYSSQWISQRGRVMNFGARFMATDASSANTVDGWNPTTNLWDAAGTFANTGGNAAGTCKNPATGDVYTCSGYFYFRKWNQATDTWSQSASGLEVYGPLVFDTSRQIVLSLSYGDNVGSATASQVNFVKCNADLTGKTAVTVNASSAYSAYLAMAPYTPALVYDAAADRYLLYVGNTGSTQTVFALSWATPTTLDMTILSVTGVTPPASFGGSQAGCNNKFVLWTNVGGSGVDIAVLLAAGGSNIHFLRLR